MIQYDDLTPCLVGVVYRFGQPPILCYDYHQVLAQYMADGMTEEEAVEHFEFNVIGWGFDETTPCFLDREPLWDELLGAEE